MTEAFQEARQQDKPVVVFLTAFWCGYCQRLDETSLSNDEVIALLNAFFIPIRVEESQRPDVDLRYNQDGWPTIAFLTPAGEHLFSVNYTAPEPFISLLVKVVDAFQRDKATLLDTAARHRAAAMARQPQEGPVPLGAAIVAEIAGMVEGWPTRSMVGTAPKSNCYTRKQTSSCAICLRRLARRLHLEHVTFTLEKMRHSRTFDARDGGFFRYSSRADWQEPHPEKLLDDQAALLRNYLRAYLLTEHLAYRETAEGLIDVSQYHPFGSLYTLLFGMPGLRATRGQYCCQSDVRTAPAAVVHRRAGVLRRQRPRCLGLSRRLVAAGTRGL